MNIKNIFLTGCLSACSLAFWACEDQLNALPTQSKVDDNLIVDQKSAEIALNGIYYMYAQCGTDYYDVLSTGCCYTQEIYPANYGGAIVYYQGSYMLENHDQMADDATALTLWQTFYATLTAANGVIYQLERAPEDWFTGNRKAEIMAEARFMRALAHYNLMRWFAQYWDTGSPYGVLLRTQPVVASTIAKDRSTVAESYACILDDIDYAIEHIVEENPNHYANTWVAKGLKVRVLMMRGQDTDYADAAALADDIIQHGPYELESHVKDLFHVKGLESREVMFGIQPKDAQTDVFEAYYYRETPNYYPSPNLEALFANDPRQDWLFKRFTEIEDGETVVRTLICKHIDPDKLEANTVEESQYQMRLAEMYLLRAEALAYQGGAANLEAAKKLVKAVQERAGYTTFTALEQAGTQQEVLQEIFHETLRSLFCESGRELEIMMRMPAEVVTPFNPFRADPEHMILPIPADEFKYNRLFKEQNPGYGKV